MTNAQEQTFFRARAILTDWDVLGQFRASDKRDDASFGEMSRGFMRMWRALQMLASQSTVTPRELLNALEATLGSFENFGGMVDLEAFADVDSLLKEAHKLLADASVNDMSNEDIGSVAMSA
jgi:hypothetical protein